MRKILSLGVLFVSVVLLPAAIFLLVDPVADAQELRKQAPSLPSPPPDYSAPLNQAQQMMAAGNYKGADRTLRTLLTSAPELADGHFLLAFALLHEDKAAESLDEYSLGAKFREPGPVEWVGVALAYRRLKDLPAAEHWLALAAKSAPARPLTWYLLGKTQYEEGHGEDAQRALLTCLRLDPHHLQAEYTLGHVYEMLQRPDAAEQAYRTAIAWQDSTEQKDTVPYLALGTLLREQGHVAEAIPLLVVAAKGDSRNPIAHQELGLAYEQLGRYNEAAGELKAAIALGPQEATTHFFLGRVDRKAGRKEESEKEFELAADGFKKMDSTTAAKP
jgi:tetratricopeptide (TPR) repeat protein